MKGTSCVGISVVLLAVLLGGVFFILDEQPSNVSELFVQLLILKARLQFGAEDGLCRSRGTDDYRVTCHHRAFEEIFAGNLGSNQKILYTQGPQAYIDNVQKVADDFELSLMASALSKYPEIDMFDTIVDTNLQVSIALPSSIPRDAIFGHHKTFAQKRAAAAVFLHSGGYSFYTSHWAAEFRARLASELGIPVISLNYTRPLDEPPTMDTQGVPTFLRESVELLEWLRDEHSIPWSNIVLIGDSAGGGMILSIANLIQQELQGEEYVKLAIGISPWTEVCEFPENGSVRKNNVTDPMVELDNMVLVSDVNFLARDPDCLLEIGKSIDKLSEKCLLLMGHGCSNEFYNPLRLADFSGVQTQFLLQVGKGELLKDDAELMHQKLINAGVQSELIISPTNIHVLPTMFPSMVDSDRIVREIFDWIQQNL